MTGETKKKNVKKLSLTTIGLVLLVIVVAANVYAWRIQLGKQVQIDSLKNEISLVQKKIKNTPEPSDNLDSRLETVKAELAVAQKTFPLTVSLNEVIDYVLEVAGESSVQVLPLVSEGWGVEKSGQVYNILKLRGTVAGSLENVTSFMNSLRSDEYPTLTISECTIQRTDGQQTAASEAEMKVNVELRIAIYTLPPAANGDAA